jgi:hypothetical protein
MDRLNSLFFRPLQLAPRVVSGDGQSALVDKLEVSPGRSRLLTGPHRLSSGDGTASLGPQCWDDSLRLCLMQEDRWRHSVSDVVEYVTTEKVTRIYFQYTSCIHTQVGHSNTLGLYWLIISYFEAFFLKGRMNISDSLQKLRISHRMSFSHYKQNTYVSQI